MTSLLTSRNRPKYTIYEKSDLLWCSPVLWVLALGLANNAFAGYSTLDEVFDIEPLVDQNIWHVRWKDSVLYLPVFRKMSLQRPFIGGNVLDCWKGVWR